MSVWVWLVSFLAQKMISTGVVSSKLSGRVKLDRFTWLWHPLRLSRHSSSASASAVFRICLVILIPWSPLSKRRP